MTREQEVQYFLLLRELAVNLARVPNLRGKVFAANRRSGLQQLLQLLLQQSPV